MSLYCVFSTTLSYCYKTLTMSHLFAGKTVNFQKVAYGNVAFLTLLGIGLFLTIIQLLRLLRLNKTIAILSHTLEQSANELAHLANVFFVIIMAFTVLQLDLLSTNINEFKDVKSTIVSLFETMLGKFNYGDWVATAGFKGEAVFLLYMFVMVFFILNIFVIILDETHHRVMEVDECRSEEDAKVVGYMLDKLKAFIGIGKPKREVEDYVVGKFVSNIL